jgi:glucose-6-phosphate isomerase
LPKIPKRGQRFTARPPGFSSIYSKNRITDQTMKLLVQLANQSGLRERITAMFNGEKINLTENRSVLHVALRAPRDAIVIGRRKKHRARSPFRPRQNG